MLSGLPPEMLKMIEEMGLDEPMPQIKKHETTNKPRKKRNRKKTNKQKAIKLSRRKNR